VGRAVKVRIKVKGVGQECPTHTGNVKGVGQECPTHTGNVKGDGRSVRPTLGDVVGSVRGGAREQQVPHRAFSPVRNDIPFLAPTFPTSENPAGKSGTDGTGTISRGAGVPQ
jgi:hypothetical protein